MGKIIRLSKSSINKKDILSVSKTLKKEYLGMGSDVLSFEKKIKNFLNTKKEVICVSSGSAALHLSLHALNLSKNDEVIIPSISFVAALQAVLAVGAKPVFCDININNGFIDIQDVKRKITNKTKVIIPVYYASDAGEIKELYKIVKTKKIRIVEDAANAFGSIVDKKKVGIYGDIICFSFDGIKNITSGEGGAILTSDKKLISELKSSRLLGIYKEDEKRYQNKKSFTYEVNKIGFRYHLSNIFASLGISQLNRIEEFKAKRQKLIKFYLKNLNIKQISFLNLNYKEIFSHIFVIKVSKEHRNRIRNFLFKNKVETGYHWKPNHTFKLCKNIRTKYLSNSVKFANQVITLPLHFDLTLKEQKKIIKLIKIYFKCH